VKPEGPADDRRTWGRPLLDYLKSPDYRPLTQRELLHRLHVAPDERAAVRRLIRRLLGEGRMIEVRGGRLAAARPSGTLCGTLQLLGETTAMVIPDNGGEEVFVSPRQVDRARHGDRVKLRVTGRQDDGRLHGLVTTVLGRGRRRVLGLLIKRGEKLELHSLEQGSGAPIQVPAPFRMGAGHLDVVEVEPLPRSNDADPEHGKVLEIVGHLDDPGTHTLIVARKYGLPLKFPAAVLDAAKGLASRIDPGELAGRTRFDDPAPCTIDGETAEDFDDAIAVTEHDAGFTLYVHIADVSHFVSPGGLLDAEAQRRGTSTYFPGRVLPMFPERLSNDLCSLRPGEDRLVQTAVLDFTAAGELREARFADGVIRSAARLTYTQVAAVLEGKDAAPAVAAPISAMLHSANKLREILERRRHELGSIDFDLPEPQILLDVEGVMTGIVIEPRNLAHRLIEEFMLAANMAVATQLERRGRSCLFRVHESPDPLKLQTLSQFVEGFGLRLDPGSDGLEPRRIQRLLEQAEGNPAYAVIGQLAVRSMKQARYSPDNVGHFGLAAPSYCHFTSPIRRYPDLVVHRQLRAARIGKADPTGNSPEAFNALAVTCSELERNSEIAERELLMWKKLAFIKDRVGERFEGVVTGVARFGLFVQLVENLVEGLIRVESLGNEWFLFDEGRLTLTGSGSGRTFRLGQRHEVTVDRVDRVLQRVDFSLADAAGERSTAPGEGVRRRQARRPPTGRDRSEQPKNRRRRAPRR